MLVALIGLLARTDAVAAPRRLEGEGLLILQGATLIRGTDARPLPRSVLAIRGTRIEAVGRIGDFEYCEDAVVLDVSGRHLIPGLIDLNAPLIRRGAGRGGHIAVPLAESLLRIMLAHGITTVRNPVGPTARSVSLRAAVASHRLIGPRIVTAGDELEDPDPESLRAAVRDQAAAGVDLVRLGPATPPAAVSATISEAHARGLRVLGALRRTDWTRASRAGIDAVTGPTCWSEAYLAPRSRERYRRSLRLGDPLEARVLWLDQLDLAEPGLGVMARWLRRRQVAVDPSLISLWSELGDDPRRAALWPKLEALVRLYHRNGVLLTAGSGGPALRRAPGAALHDELERLVAAGIPPAEVLRIATRNGARALGLLGELGTIEPGHRADLVVLLADPLRDIRHTQRIEIVFRDGVPYSPQTLLRQPPDGLDATARAGTVRADRCGYSRASS
jgi:hypothetical protein